MSHEILMFVCNKTPCNAVMPQSSSVLIVLVTNQLNEYNRGCDIVALYDGFLEIN